MATKLTSPSGKSCLPAGRFYLCDTEIGFIGLLLSPRGLRATTLPRPSRDQALREVAEMGADEPASEAEAGDLPRRLRALAQGQPLDLTADIDWDSLSAGGRGLSGFRRAVLAETLRIPSAGLVPTAGSPLRLAGPALPAPSAASWPPTPSPSSSPATASSAPTAPSTATAAASP